MCILRPLNILRMWPLDPFKLDEKASRTLIALPHSTLTSSARRVCFKKKHGVNRMYYNLIHRKFIRFLKKVQQPDLKEAELIQT